MKPVSTLEPTMLVCEKCRASVSLALLAQLRQLRSLEDIAIRNVEQTRALRVRGDEVPFMDRIGHTHDEKELALELACLKLRMVRKELRVINVHMLNVSQDFNEWCDNNLALARRITNNFADHDSDACRGADEEKADEKADEAAEEKAAEAEPSFTIHVFHENGAWPPKVSLDSILKSLFGDE
jgi:hypothetical protein